MPTPMQVRIISEEALQALNALRLPGESYSACADRLLGNLLVVAYNQANYAAHFGPQERQLRAATSKKARSAKVVGRD